MRAMVGTVLEWRAPSEAGAQGVLLRAAAREADEGSGLLSLWFWNSEDTDELVLYAVHQDRPADAYTIGGMSHG